MVAFTGCLPVLEVTLPACCDNVGGALSDFGVFDTITEKLRYKYACYSKDGLGFRV